MDSIPSCKSFARFSTWSRIALAMALAALFAINGTALADTFWTADAPTSVSDLINGDYWDNGAPTSADNPGYIINRTLTVTSDFKPGANGQNIDLTFSQDSDVTMNNAFVPLANLASGQKGTVTFRLTGNANVYVGGNFWGGTNDYNRSYSLGEGEYLLYQYYGGDSTFSSNEWWSAMSVKTYIKISDNAKVTARGGNSGLGWDDSLPSSSYGSVLELTDNGKLVVNSTNLNIWGTDTKVNMFDNSTFTANTVVVSHDTPRFNLNDNSQFTVSNTLKLDDKAAMSVNGNANLTVANDFAMDRNGALTVNDNAVVNLNRQVKIGDSNNGEAGGAVFTQTGGKVTVSGTTYFSYHSDATVNLSGGQFICNSSELYVTDKRDCKADINMTDNGYLQANDLRLSQHGHTNLTMSGNSQIKATTVNAAYNFDAGDNVVNVNILNDFANITANNLYFSKGNTEGNGHTGAAYGSFTLNDNATIVIANETKVGVGTATDLIEGKDYAAEITLNGNCKFSTKTFTTTAGTKSATTVNGSAILEAETITIAPNSFLNVNGGSVNVTSLNNAGTVNLAGGAITLNPYGLITSTEGTFNAASGAVNITVPAGVTYSAGDQMIVGYFADDSTATAVSGKTVVPENWQVSVVSMGDTQKAVVASYGDAAPTGVKIWKAGTNGSMTEEANWEGDFSNPTGYVLDGTNTLSGITGKTAIMGGTNTLSGAIPSGAVIAINGGATTYNSPTINGSLLVNEGTLTSSSGNFTLGDGNGAVFNQTGGKVTVAGTTYFSFHADATVNLSGGQFISNSNQLYVTDNKQSTAIIKMTGDSYLQAKDLRLSQHGKTNLTMSDDSHLSVTTFNLGYNYSNGDNVESIVTMSGNSRLDNSGSFIAFHGNNEINHSGAAYASFTMSDNAYAYIGGNTWGGSNDGGNVAGLISGKNYNLEMTFKDNSYFSTGEFWMAMAGKVHVTIQDNATVIARSGSSGLGWCEKTDGSLLEIKGGTLQVDSNNFLIGHTSTNATTGRANVQQTGGTAIYKVLEIRHKDSGYYISGDNSVMTSGSISTVAGSTLSIAGGTVNVGTITNNGTIDFTGGTFNMGTGGISGSGTINLAGGTVTSGADALAEAQRGKWTSSANATLTGTGDSRVTFAPAANTSITWSGVISGVGGLIVNGDGTFALATPSTYTGLTSVEKGTFEIAFADPATAVTIASIDMADNTVINIASGTVSFTDADVTLKNLSGGSVSDSGAAAVSSDLNVTGKLTLDNDYETRYVGTITATTIEKTGDGTLQLFAAADGAGIQAGNFIVSSGRLDMKDYYVGTLEVEDGATLSPGNSVGTLTVDGDVVLNSAAILLIEQDETGIDQLIAKSFNIDDNAVLELAVESTQPGQSYEILFQKDGNTAVDFEDKYATDDFWNSILSSESGYYWNLSVNGNVVMATLDANAVPEPSTWALLILGAAGLLYWRKRK